MSLHISSPAIIGILRSMMIRSAFSKRWRERTSSPVEAVIIVKPDRKNKLSTLLMASLTDSETITFFIMKGRLTKNVMTY